MRHLSDVEYNTWEHDFSRNFEGRIEQNYVQTTLYNNDPLLDPNGINNERRKAFMDPLGRNYSVATGYSTTATNHVEIHSGTVRYDNWGSTGVYFDYVYSNASSQDWLASFTVWLPNPSGGGGGSYAALEINDFDSEFYPDLLEKEYFYGQNVNDVNIGKLTKTVSYNNSSLAIQKTELSYDTFNNLNEQIVTFNPEASVLGAGSHLVSKITYDNYNYRNSLLEQRVDVDNDNVIDYHCFMEYDQLNRLKSISAATGYAASMSEATLLVSYEHDDANGLVAKKKHYIEDSGFTTLVQNIEYLYDTRDRLTDINSNHPRDPKPIMRYHLYYDDQVPLYTNGAQTELVSYTSNWNGNINGTQMTYDFDFNFVNITSNDFELPTLYGYTYDKINRLIKADAVVGDFVEGGTNALVSRQIGDVNLTYDRIGNIKTLHRTAINNATGSGVPLTTIQHWNYGYQNGTNRLQYANGMSGTATRAYTYDANGNVLTDDSKELNETEYGRAACPFRLKLGSAEEIYLYSVDDQRIYKKSVRNTIVTEDYYLLDAMGKTIALLHTNGSSSNWEFYASGAERECRITPIDASPNISVEEASFFLYDHLGNTRITYTPLEVNGIIGMRINAIVDYFPYGKALREFYETSDKERFLTTQHERDEYTGLDYRSARYYDSDVARFLSLDPLAKDYASWSAYNYVMGNPVLYLDPTGKAVETTFVDEYGNTIVKTDDGSDDVFVIEEKNIDKFIEDLDALATYGIDDNEYANKAIGSSYGYIISETFNERYPAFVDNPDFGLGYQCNYEGSPGACAGKNAIQMAGGKGTGIATYGAQRGSADKAKGYMNAIEPEIKGNKAQYVIKTVNKTTIKMKDKIETKKRSVVKQLE